MCKTIYKYRFLHILMLGGDSRSKVEFWFEHSVADILGRYFRCGFAVTVIPVFLFCVFILPSICFSDIGAEWNPTGNPIGGGPGYSDSIRHQDADYYVCTKAEFLNAVANASSGDIIYVADSAEINMTGTERVFIPGHVTLASGRGRILADTVSWGGLLYTDDTDDNSLDFLMMSGKGVRITGLRVRGPYWYRKGKSTLDTFSLANSSYGVQAWYDSLVVDNCEFWGWSHSCIYSATSRGFYVHHNYFHEGQNCCMGMGGCTGSTGNGIWEANLFDFVRHNIASTGDTMQSWEARWNIGLEHGANHNFDRHGWPSEGEYGGRKTIIHHNTCRKYARVTQTTTGGENIRIRGLPVQACSIYNNWLYPSDSAAAIKLWTGNTNCWIFDNHFGTTVPAGLNSRIPVAEISVDLDSGTVPLNVSFSSNGSYDPDGDLSWWEWDFGDNANTVRKPNVTYTFNDIGIYNVELTVHDNDGIPTSANKLIVVGPSNDSFYLSVWVNDRCHSADTGFFFKQILLNGNVVWEDDIAFCEGWTHVVANVTPYVIGQDSVTVACRLYCKKNYTQGINEIVTYWDDIALFWGSVRNGGFESDSGQATSVWNYSENNMYFHGIWTSSDVRSGNSAYQLMYYSGFDCTQGEYGEISQKVDVGALGLLYDHQRIEPGGLDCIYPNPAFQRSNIDYVLSSPSNVRIGIFDVSGRLVRSLVEQTQNPGEYSIVWDGKDTLDRQVASGVYFCRLVVDNCQDVKQIVWVR
ncbi:MAG: T9SS type A sorting domain-containing protein [candidate division WOR-3 bacterium]|nr:MAG: T9SS type A sorting domain-containing protein [candidate division WOR-3 bacterium]